jgi:uncharacterized protein (DUF697 family)/GTP-binding protein EngB required for normal cell division
VALAGDRWQMLGLVGLIWLLFAGHNRWQELSQNQAVVAPAGKESLQQALAQVMATIAELSEPSPKEVLAMSATAIADSLQAPQPRVAIVGLQGVGKTAVISALRGEPDTTANTVRWLGWSGKGGKKITLLDTHTTSGEIDQVTASSAELVVLVVAGDLTATEYNYIKTMLAHQHQRLLIAFNKSDLYLVSDQQTILKQIRQRCAGLLDERDVVMIAAKPRPIKVRQYDRDSGLPVRQWQEELPPVIAPLKQRIEQVLEQEWERLWLDRLRQQIQQLQHQAEQALQEQRRKLAESAISKYQSIIALSVFASPLATLDLAATLTLNIKLLMEIGEIYRQPLTLNQAQCIAKDMIKQLVQLGGVELATAAIAGFLKTNFVTYAIGGAVQGISAAYLTHVCGCSWISYLEQKGKVANATTIPRAIYEQQLQRLSSAEFLAKFVPSLVARLHIPASSRQ